MKITLIQDTIVWADIKANLLQTENKLQQLSDKTDLIVLPEMFTTGFCTEQLHLAEAPGGITEQKLRGWAVEFHFALTGSYIVNEEKKFFNRAFFAYPDGRFEYADKRHLFSMGGEHHYFSNGNQKLLVEYGGFRIFVLVCYDIRFPVWSRNVNNEYDLLIYVANFPQKRIEDWDILLKARAIENQAYVCGVNRIGIDGNGIAYNGHSVMLDYKANNLLFIPENETNIQTVDIDYTPLKTYREKFPVWKDADQFEIKKDA
jgi:predicted amidohydrolase